MTKKDVIMFDKREELAEDHLFLRTELGQYAFQLGFDTAAESIVEQACEWLEKNGGGYWMDDYDLPTDELVNDFRKAMKGK